VLAGVSTDCCVISTALAAADSGVQVVVVEEACAGSDDANHVKALDVMRLYAPLVQVVSLDDALARAAQRAADRDGGTRRDDAVGRGGVGRRGVGDAGPDVLRT
jgi:isochorismate hydrolase